MKFNILIISLFIMSNCWAQKTTTMSLLSDKSYQTIVDINVGDIKQLNVNTPQGESVKINIDKGTSLLEKGLPDLPKLSFSLIVPNKKNSSISIVESEFTDYQNVNVAPSKGKIYRNENPNLIPFTFNEQYSKNEFYPQNLVAINKPFIVRDFRGQSIHVFPIQYNPITKVLRVYNHLKVKVEYAGISTENIIESNENPANVVEEFNNIYSNQFLNYSSLSKRYSPLSQQGSMLIICPAIYLNEIAPYNKWKQMKGIKTYLVNTDTLQGGVNDSTIYNLVKNYYNKYQIAYATIVGDHANIPTRDVNYQYSDLMGPCDNCYGYVNNNDHYPEVIIGRISGENIDEINTQVFRTIQYEKTPNLNSNWFQHQIGMSSDQGPGDDNQFDYEHICDILDSNKNQYNYLNSKLYADGTQLGCNDDATSPTNTEILNEINSGIGLINYCGHGSTYSFSTSGFSINDAPSLTNFGQWPFIFSTACVNGNFMYTTCLAESLLRAKDVNGNPTGAIATVMSTINQSWDPPMQGQDEMNAILRGGRANNKKTTFGCIVANGNMSVLDNYNTFSDPHGGDEIADTWTVFGDPSVEVRTKNEGAITCSYSGWTQLNSTTFDVGCNVEGATIGLYYQGKFWDVQTVSNGAAHFSFTPLNTLDTLFVTATKQNYSPHLGYSMVVNYPTTINNIDINNLVSISPNPFSDVLEIKSLNNLKINAINIIDMSGKIVLTSNSINTNIILNTNSLSKGVYQIEINTNYGNIRKKLVK